MISSENYELLKKQYGLVSSWAVWKRAGATPRSNTESMAWVEAPELLSILNTGFVFVGLNASSTHGNQGNHFTKAWSNFHSGYSRQNDYKLRYALQDTKYWGSYITDIIKRYPEVDSGKVDAFLRKHPEVVEENVIDFEKEISYLGDKPVLVALGGKSFNILNTYLSDKYKVVQVKHYSFTIGKEDYRREVLEVLDRVK